MDELDMLFGECLHGHSLMALGVVVQFVRDCVICESTLRREGYDVSHLTAHALAA